MLKVFTHPDRVLVGLVADIVATNGYHCHIRNEYLGGVSGDVPPQECWPELWLLDDLDERLVRALIATVTPRSPPDGEPWQCPRCGEWLEPQFGACWRCEVDATR